MNPKNMIHITRVFPNTHIFVYRKKEFPFNFDLFKLTFQVFSNKAEDIKHNKYIELLSHEEESNIEISDESINIFIKYVHRETISIEEDNVISLNYLGHKYQIDELIESTKEYISEHQSGLVLEILSREVNQKGNIKNMSTYEDIVTEHFLDYINDNRIFNLPITTIYRIFNKYQQKKHQQKDDQNQQKNKDEENDQIFDFLIKCLDKYGRQASVLFGELNSDDTKSQYLNVLLNNYSKSFDFHFLNSNLIHEKYEQENENIMNSEKSAKDQNEIIDKLTKEVLQLKEIQATQTGIINELKAKLETYEKEREKQAGINSDFEEQKKEIIKIKEEQVNQKNIAESNQKRLDELNNITIKKLEEKIDNLKKELENNKHELAQSKEKIENMIGQQVPYDKNQSNRFNGILTKLGNGNAMNSLNNKMVEITASSICNPFGHVQPKNVLNYSDDKQVFESKKEPNSWLCIEFKTHRVNPSHYSIKTTDYGDENNCIPQDWDIDGSNDKTNWDPLDSRRNEQSIRKAKTSNTFEITNASNKHNYYKYLRIIQRGKNTNGDERLFFSSIEFFGNIKNQ